METMKIALPESMKTFVLKRVAEGGFGGVSPRFLSVRRIT